jgi:hypothetical protein
LKAVNAIIFTVITLLREEPLSTGVLDVIVVVVVVVGGVRLKLTFSERVVEVRNSPKFFTISRIEFTSS